MPQPSYLQQITRRASGMPILKPARSPLGRTDILPLLEMPEAPVPQQSLPLPPSTRQELTADVEEQTSYLTATSVRDSTSISSPPAQHQDSIGVTTPSPSASLNRPVEATFVPSTSQENLHANPRPIVNPEMPRQTSPDKTVFIDTSEESRPIPGKQTNLQSMVIPQTRERKPQPEGIEASVGRNPPRPRTETNALLPVSDNSTATTAQVDFRSPNRPEQESLPQSWLSQPASTPTWSTPVATQTELPKGNSIHIGSIDVHIVPPPAVPAKVAPTRAKSGSTSTLSRGFTSSFGLRQG